MCVCGCVCECECECEYECECVCVCWCLHADIPHQQLNKTLFFGVFAIMTVSHACQHGWQPSPACNGHHPRPHVTAVQNRGHFGLWRIWPGGSVVRVQTTSLCFPLVLLHVVV